MATQSLYGIEGHTIYIQGYFFIITKDESQGIAGDVLSVKKQKEQYG